jgi:hypothetical protein
VSDYQLHQPSSYNSKKVGLFVVSQKVFAFRGVLLSSSRLNGINDSNKNGIMQRKRRENLRRKVSTPIPYAMLHPSTVYQNFS